MGYRIEWEHNGAHVYFWGRFDNAINKQAFLEIINAPGAEYLRYILWDLSAITNHLATEEDTILTAIQYRDSGRTRPSVRLAVFVQDEAHRRLKRRYTALYEGQRQGWDFMVSNDLAAIRTWLGIDRGERISPYPVRR